MKQPPELDDEEQGGELLGGGGEARCFCGLNVRCCDRSAVVGVLDCLYAAAIVVHEQQQQ